MLGTFSNRKPSALLSTTSRMNSFTKSLRSSALTAVGAVGFARLMPLARALLYAASWPASVQYAAFENG